MGYPTSRSHSRNKQHNNQSVCREPARETSETELALLSKAELMQLQLYGSDLRLLKATKRRLRANSLAEIKVSETDKQIKNLGKLFFFYF